jgi:hypothetical protein
MHKIKKIIKNKILTSMQVTDIPSLSKTNIRAHSKLSIPVINKVGLIFFSILFDFENTGIKNN